MKAQRITQLALVLALGLIVARLTDGPLQHNLSYLLANNAFSSRYPASESYELLRTAVSLACTGNLDCGVSAVESRSSVVGIAREKFIKDQTPMRIVSDSIRIASEEFSPSGFPDSLQDVDVAGVMYGPGTLNLRLYLESERSGCWQIAVKAKHDDPPPVDLEVWIDRDLMGTLSYARGDQSWEVLTMNKSLGPNLHNLGITFANDYLEQETGADRNAYIEYVEMTRLEDSYCKND